MLLKLLLQENEAIASFTDMNLLKRILPKIVNTKNTTKSENLKANVKDRSTHYVSFIVTCRRDDNLQENGLYCVKCCEIVQL